MFAIPTEILKLEAKDRPDREEIERAIASLEKIRLSITLHADLNTLNWTLVALKKKLASG
jgi:hypothetical protein